VSDALYYVERLVTPHRPRVVVFYAGENDIAAGEAPRRVADDFRAFVSKVRAARPDTKIVFIGLKPSPSRWKMIGHFREANALVRAFCESQENMVFVDVERAMLDADGRPREELFLKDMLHMNRAGYEIWTGLVRPHLDGAAAAPSTRPAG
jgi:lysophospholipase L1-like esterase